MVRRRHIIAGMFEEAEVDGLLVWLNTPRDGAITRTIDPSNEI